MQLLKSKKDNSTAVARASKANNNNVTVTSNAPPSDATAKATAAALAKAKEIIRSDGTQALAAKEVARRVLKESQAAATSRNLPPLITTTPSPKCRTAAEITKCCTTRTGNMPSIHIADN